MFFLWKFDFPPSPPHFNCEYELIYKRLAVLMYYYIIVLNNAPHPVGVRGRSSEVGTPTVPRYVSGPLEMEAPSHLNWSHWRWKNEPEEHKKSKVTNLRDVEQ